MLTYVVRRLLYSIPVLVVSSFITFSFVSLAGDPRANLRANPAVSQLTLNNLIHKYHLDASIPARYWYWVQDVFTHKLGVSLNTSQPIWPDIERAMGHTAQVILIAQLIALVLGVAVGIFDIIKQLTTNPLLKEMLRRVELDESRHAAFGILTMRRLVQDATPEEMVEFEEFAFEVLEALNANQQLDMLHDLCPKYGLDADNVVAMLLAQPEWARFNSDVFMHTVVPNLARLGLITERTESRYRACGILWGNRFGSGTDADVQSSLASS